MLSRSSLRTRIVYDLAVRYAASLWRAGAAFRGGYGCGLWVLLAWFPAGDGPGTPAEPAGVRTSLRILDEHLHRFDGAVVAEPPEGGGTRVLTWWRSSPW